MATWTYTIGSGYYYNHYQLSGNATNVKNYLSSKGFTEAAIIGIIANMEHESYLNPAQQEHGKGGSPQYGYGLVQWTPASSKIIAYANSVSGNWYDGDIQMDYLMINGPATWIKSQNYPYTWNEYKQLTDIYEATRTFFWNFERGTWDSAMDDYAYHWDEVLYQGATPPIPPDPNPPTPPSPPYPEDEDLFLLNSLFLSKNLQ